MDSKNTTVIRQNGTTTTHMQHFFRRFGVHQLMILALIASVSLGTVGCKAKKEARARQEALDAKIADAKATLLAIINDKTMPLSEKEQELERIKALNLQDSEILDLIDRAEAAIAEQKAAEAEASKKDNAAPNASGDATSRLGNIFQEVASAGSNDMANTKIREALSMFSSTDTPLLIIISQDGGQNDYDEPTTIQKYLNYLKDTKAKPARVHNLEYDANGKIKEIELIKSY